MNIQDEIIKAVNIIVDKKISQLNIGYDIPSVVVEVGNNKYKVMINGKEYWIKDGVNCSPSKGNAVWVRNPGDMSKAFIEALR